MKPATAATVILFCLAQMGCASTQFETSGQTPTQAVCKPKTEHVSALVLWGPIWRSNQKDVPLREEAALRGIEEFVAGSSCFSRAEVRRLPGGRIAEIPTAEQMQALAATLTPPADTVLVIAVRELGPVLQVLGPIAAFGGGTEVVLDLQLTNVRTGKAIANFGAHWSNGGSFVIKSTKTLPQDMRQALQAALEPSEPVR